MFWYLKSCRISIGLEDEIRLLAGLAPLKGSDRVPFKRGFGVPLQGGCKAGEELVEAWGFGVPGYFMTLLISQS